MLLGVVRSGKYYATQAIDDIMQWCHSDIEQQYVTRQLTRLAGSFTPSASGIQNNFDSIYLVFNLMSTQLLNREIMYRQQQAVDLVAPTADLINCFITIKAYESQLRFPDTFNGSTSTGYFN